MTSKHYGTIDTHWSFGCEVVTKDCDDSMAVRGKGTGGTVTLVTCWGERVAPRIAVSMTLSALLVCVDEAFDSIAATGSGRTQHSG